MIVQCPRCKKRYDLDDTRLDKGAVNVRCRTCEHIWVLRRGVEVSQTTVNDEGKLRVAPEPAPEGEPSYLDRILLLRAAVAVYGEHETRNWWGTEGSQETGQFFFSDIFPRTARWVGLEVALRGGQKLHSSQPYFSRTRVNLFRLGLPWDERLWARFSSLKMTGPSDHPILDLVHRSDQPLPALLEPLQIRFDAEKIANSGDGPVETGTIDLKRISARGLYERLRGIVHYYAGDALIVPVLGVL